jgi:DNA-binding SARP family transcriptional activator
MATASKHAGDRPPVAIRLLNGFQLWVGEQCVPVMPSSQRLLAFLALHDGWVTRSTLAGALWPGTTDRRAASCLRSALWRLVQPRHALVDPHGGVLGLDPSIQVDVAVVRRFAAELARPGTPVPAAVPAVATLAADLLPGWTEPWVSTERDWFRQMCLRALETLSERFRSIGDHFHAHETAIAAVRGDPLRESAHRRLIELHLADGNPAAALRQYTSYRSMLRRELGLVPSAEIRQLVQPMLARPQ